MHLIRKLQSNLANELQGERDPFTSQFTWYSRQRRRHVEYIYILEYKARIMESVGAVRQGRGTGSIRGTWKQWRPPQCACVADIVIDHPASR